MSSKLRIFESTKSSWSGRGNDTYSSGPRSLPLPPKMTVEYTTVGLMPWMKRTGARVVNISFSVSLPINWIASRSIKSSLDATAFSKRDL